MLRSTTSNRTTSVKRGSQMIAQRAPRPLDGSRSNTNNHTQQRPHPLRMNPTKSINHQSYTANSRFTRNRADVHQGESLAKLERKGRDVPVVGEKIKRTLVQATCDQIVGSKVGRFLGQAAMHHDLANLPRLPEKFVVGMPDDLMHSRNSYLDVSNLAIDAARQCLPKGSKVVGTKFVVSHTDPATGKVRHTILGPEILDPDTNVDLVKPSPEEWQKKHETAPAELEHPQVSNNDHKSPADFKSKQKEDDLFLSEGEVRRHPSCLRPGYRSSSAKAGPVVYELETVEASNRLRRQMSTHQQTTVGSQDKIQSADSDSSTACSYGTPAAVPQRLVKGSVHIHHKPRIQTGDGAGPSDGSSTISSISTHSKPVSIANFPSAHMPPPYKSPVLPQLNLSTGQSTDLRAMTTTDYSPSNYFAGCVPFDARSEGTADASNASNHKSSHRKATMGRLDPAISPAGLNALKSIPQRPLRHKPKFDFDTSSTISAATTSALYHPPQQAKQNLDMPVRPATDIELRRSKRAAIYIKPSEQQIDWRSHQQQSSLPRPATSIPTAIPTFSGEKSCANRQERMKARQQKEQNARKRMMMPVDQTIWGPDGSMWF